MVDKVRGTNKVVDYQCYRHFIFDHGVVFLPTGDDLRLAQVHDDHHGEKKQSNQLEIRMLVEVYQDEGQHGAPKEIDSMVQDRIGALLVDVQIRIHIAVLSEELLVSVVGSDVAEDLEQRDAIDQQDQDEDPREDKARITLLVTLESHLDIEQCIDENDQLSLIYG